MKHLKIIFGLVFFSFTLANGQQGEGQQIPMIGSKAPAFMAPSTNGLVSFPYDFEGKWKILFSHPRDFTPVCSSEILELAYLQEEFEDANCQIVVLSVDQLDTHQSWKADLEGIDYKGRGKRNIFFPLVADRSSDIAYSYGMIDPNVSATQSIRGVFYIDPDNIIRAFQFYPSEVGRNTAEILRTLKALQARDRNPYTVIPGNWQPGDDHMLPVLRPEDKKELEKADSNIRYLNWYMIFKKGDS